MRTSSLLFLASLLCASTTSHAATGLEWRLDDAPATYLMDAQLLLPQILYVRAQNNIDRRTNELRLQLVTTCAVEDLRGKKAWDLTCTLDDVALYAAPVQAEAGELLPVLDEWDARLTGGKVRLRFTRDGQVKDLSLDEPYESMNQRTIEIRETMRLLLARVFSSMDLQLPKGADDQGSTWRQSDSSAFGFVDPHGTMGSVALQHRVTGVEDAIVTIQSDAKGTVGPGVMIVVGNSERPANLYDTKMQSLALFDTTRGRLVSRRFLSEGTPTASSQSSDGFQGYPYIQDVSLNLVEGEAPALGANQEIQSEGPSTFETGVTNP